MKKITSHLCPVAFAILSLGSGMACASSVTLDGTDVSFTFDDSLLGMFGTPMVTGDALFFTPTNFNAVSTNGSGTTLTSSNLNVLIKPNQGVMLSSVGLQERGEYSANGSGSSVGVGGQIRAFDVAKPFTVEDTSSLTSPDLGTNDNMFHNWAAAANIDLGTAKWQTASAIDFTIENVLDATTTNSNPSKAFISKEFAGISVDVNGDPPVPPSAVPVPASAWLFGSGLVGLVGIGRRRGKISGDGGDA